jgi:hypothetical protein
MRQGVYLETNVSTGVSWGRRMGDLPYRVSRRPRKHGDPLAAPVGDAPINKKK